jgi:hypothetical protein
VHGTIGGRSISHNRLGPVGGREWAEALLDSSQSPALTLRQLDLSCNRMGEDVHLHGGEEVVAAGVQPPRSRWHQLPDGAHFNGRLQRPALN